MNCKIFLTRGKVALVDAEDYAYLNQFKCGHGTFYAVRSEKKDGKWTLLVMHREIMEVPKGMDTDHRNGNGLDNRKHNLRPCNKSKNAMNSTLYTNNTSGYKGVSWYEARKQWCAYIRINSKQIHLGYFENKEQAALAYNEAAKKYFGEFAKLNTWRKTHA